MYMKIWIKVKCLKLFLIDILYWEEKKLKMKLVEVRFYSLWKFINKIIRVKMLFILIYCCGKVLIFKLIKLLLLILLVY